MRIEVFSILLYYSSLSGPGRAPARLPAVPGGAGGRGGPRQGVPGACQRRVRPRLRQALLPRDARGAVLQGHEAVQGERKKTTK